MAMVVKRPKLSPAEWLYLPAIVSGLAITFKHIKKIVSGQTKVTMQYPEERWGTQSCLPGKRRNGPCRRWSFTKAGAPRYQGGSFASQRSSGVLHGHLRLAGDDLMCLKVIARPLTIAGK